jgi:TldD protein
MSLDKDVAEFSMNFALKSGASYAEARLENVFTENFILKNGTAEVADLTSEKGIGIRVLADGGAAFTTSERLDKQIIQRRIKEAIRFAKVSAKHNNEQIVLSEEKASRARWEVKAKRKIEDVSSKEKLGLLLDAEKSLSKLKSKVPSRFMQMTNTINEKYYINSDGSKISSLQPRVMVYYSLVAVVGGQSEQRYFQLGNSGGWEVTKKWKLSDKITNEAQMLVKIIEKAKQTPNEQVDVILSPELVGIITHESSGHPSELDRIFGREGAQAGESFLTTDWMGRRIGSNEVNVVDFPATDKNAYGYYEFDDEGIPAKKRFLIKDGMINEFLNNREFARKINVHSNGAARASKYDREPLVRMANTYMLPGSHTVEELFEGVKKGVYIKSFT